ncbi:MAG TPA: hypothetical protein VGQ83_26580 [Polyangia bacterium]|jgi:hypothetical protein
MLSRRVPVFARLAPQGTRVVVLKRQPCVAGIIREVRRETYLRTYVVECDDGEVVFASACDLAREDDAARTPFGLPTER